MQQLNFLPSEPRRPLELRDYQRQMKRDIYAHIKAGTNRILVYGPTGSGKTLVLSSVLQDALSKSRRCLLLVHRDFLVEQAMQTLLNLGVEGDQIGIIKAGYPEDRTRPLQIAGLQSLNNRAIPEDIGLVVADECHSVAFWGGYQRVKDAAPDAIQLGFTASPWRLKPHIEYFGQHYDVIVRGPSIKELTKHGYLSPVRYFGFEGVDVSKLETGSSGDFQLGSMERSFILSEIPQIVVRKIQELCKDRTGIIFNAGVEQSLLQTQLLNEAGIWCAHVDANTPAVKRQRIYQNLEEGKIRCISSIGCLTEGFDVKSLSFIVLARATKSRALYVQMAGRGIRFHPDKKNCLLLDFGDNIKRRKLGFLTTNWAITLEPTLKEEGGLPQKTCPECFNVCWAFMKVCPECGHEFEFDGKVDPLDLEDTFNELFDAETKKIVKFARALRKRHFKENQPPDAFWKILEEKYSETCILNDWLKNAILGGDCTIGNQQRFLDYLNEWKPFDTLNAELWTRHHIGIEFGWAIDIKSISCWRVLGVTKQFSKKDIKKAYQNALKLVDDAEQSDLLDWAFDKAMNEKLGLSK